MRRNKAADEVAYRQARKHGIADAKNRSREHAVLWPPGVAGHADYELGHQEVELARERTLNRPRLDR